MTDGRWVCAGLDRNGLRPMRYTVTGDGLSFGPIASTRRMCQDVMAQEDAFLQALENAHRFSISGEDLAIENANGEVSMRFAAVYMK